MLHDLTERSSTGETLEALKGWTTFPGAQEHYVQVSWSWKELPPDSLLLPRFWDILDWGSGPLASGGLNQSSPPDMLGWGREVTPKEGSLLVQKRCFLPMLLSNVISFGVSFLNAKVRLSASLWFHIDMYLGVFNLSMPSNWSILMGNFFTKHLLGARNSSKWSKILFPFILTTTLLGDFYYYPPSRDETG